MAVMPTLYSHICSFLHYLEHMILVNVKLDLIQEDYISRLHTLLPPATKLWQGNVFTPVCHSVHRGGVCEPPCAVQAGGTHPTGMQSFWSC